MQKSITRNYMYSLILNVFNFIYPIITFPYIARILNADGLGRIDFTSTLVHYFVILAQLGISTYSIRECSRIRDDNLKLRTFIHEITIINLISVIITYLLFYFIITNTMHLVSYRDLIIIYGLNIFSVNFGFEWYFHSIEEYKYIGIRSILIKIISIFSIFIFVKDNSDLNNYAYISVTSIFLTSFANFLLINEKINLFKINIKGISLKKHFAPILVFFGTSVINTLYSNVDKTMLGFIAGDRYVGLYSAAYKLISVILPFITTLTIILLPRMSHYVASNKSNDTKELIENTFDFLFMISIPATIGLMINSKAIILLLAGENYSESIITLKILSLILILTAMVNTLGSQILLAFGKENKSFIANGIGLILNILLNYTLIPLYMQNGAAIATIISTSTVLIILLIYSREYIKSRINFYHLFQYIVASVLIVLINILVQSFVSDFVFLLVTSIIVSIMVYFGVLILFKNGLVLKILNQIKKGLNYEKK